MKTFNKTIGQTLAVVLSSATVGACAGALKSDSKPVEGVVVNADVPTARRPTFACTYSRTSCYNCLHGLGACKAFRFPIQQC